MSSLIGWAHTQNNSCSYISSLVLSLSHHSVTCFCTDLYLLPYHVYPSLRCTGVTAANPQRPPRRLPRLSSPSHRVPSVWWTSPWTCEISGWQHGDAAWHGNMLLLTLVPGGTCLWFKCRKFRRNMGINILTIQINITLERMLEDVFDGKSTLLQVMVLCCQTTSHYLNQCWLGSLMSYGITGPQWVNLDVIWHHWATMS